jgi:hypothetical protein
MDRRLAGVVVLVLALVAVMVVPSIAGRRTAGSAVAIALPDPPQVGDCLLAPITPSSGPGGWPREIPYAPDGFGDCDGQKTGEVVAVWDTPAEANEAARSRLGGPCYRQAAAFAGLVRSGRSTILPGGAADPQVAWKPTIGFVPYRIVPGEVAQNAGQAWVACLAAARAPSTYSGSLRDAYTTGDMADAFALCWSGHDLDAVPTVLPCDQPHPTELLATGWIRDRSAVSSSELNASCMDLAASIMHTVDPTRQGALSVVVDPFQLDGASRPDAPLSVNCFVTSAGLQQLTGTVIGLGAGPIPFEQ